MANCPVCGMPDDVGLSCAHVPVKETAENARIGEGKAGPGRPKGSENKTTRALKEAILAAAEKHGYDGDGEDGLEGYLLKIAGEEPRAFVSLLGRVLPLTVNGKVQLPVYLEADTERL